MSSFKGRKQGGNNKKGEQEKTARREENDICLSLDPLTYLPSVIDSGPKVIIVQSRAFMMTPSFQVEYFALLQGSTAGWGVGGGDGEVFNLSTGKNH